MAEEKKAKKVYSLDEIKFNEKNKTMAILACIPVVGLVLMLVEKEDLFIKYTGAQYTLLLLLSFILGVIASIPIVGWIIGIIVLPLFSLGALVLMVLGMVKASKGERFDIPVLSGYALKVMAMLN